MHMFLVFLSPHLFHATQKAKELAKRKERGELSDILNMSPKRAKTEQGLSKILIKFLNVKKITNFSL